MKKVEFNNETSKAHDTECSICGGGLRTYYIGDRSGQYVTCKHRAKHSIRQVDTAQLYTKREYGRFPIYPSRRALIRRPFGIELETTNGGEYALRAYSTTGFSGVSDVTINEEVVNGRALEKLELLSPVLTDDTGLDVIKKLCDIPLRVNKSCGYHLHLSTDGWQDLELHKLLLVCFRNLDLFWSLVDPDRRGGSYCRDTYPSATVVGQIEPERRFSSWEALAKGESGVIEAFGKEMNGDPFGGSTSHNTSICGQRMTGATLSRYNWLNLCPVVSRKALEIRSHEGAVDYDTIRSWILLWQGIFSFIEETPLKVLLEGTDEIPLQELTLPSVAAFYEAKRVRPEPTLFTQPVAQEAVEPPMRVPLAPVPPIFDDPPPSEEGDSLGSPHNLTSCPCNSCENRRAGDHAAGCTCAGCGYDRNGGWVAGMVEVLLPSDRDGRCRCGPCLMMRSHRRRQEYRTARMTATQAAQVVAPVRPISMSRHSGTDGTTAGGG